MGVLFLVNPIAGRGKARSIVPIIKEVCKSLKTDYQIKFTSCPGDATNIAKDAAKEGYDRIIAVGGDGTLNEVLNGIVGEESALGVVPGGSGNDFIKSINKSRDIRKIVRDNINGQIRMADIGDCGGRYFINIASAGFDALAAYNVEQIKKFFSGKIAYIAAAVKSITRHKGIRVKVRIDGNEIEEDMLLLSVANGKYYGGGLLPAPKAEIDDGLFDICLIRNIPKFKFIGLAPKYMSGNLDGIEEVRCIRGKKVELESDDYFYINVDGEVLYKKQIDFSILPRSIKIIAPENIGEA